MRVSGAICVVVKADFCRKICRPVAGCLFGNSVIREINAAVKARGAETRFTNFVELYRNYRRFGRSFSQPFCDEKNHNFMLEDDVMRVEHCEPYSRNCANNFRVLRNHSVLIQNNLKRSLLKLVSVGQ